MKKVLKAFVGIGMICFLCMSVDCLLIANKKNPMFDFFTMYLQNENNEMIILGPGYYFLSEGTGLGITPMNRCENVRLGVWFLPTFWKIK